MFSHLSLPCLLILSTVVWYLPWTMAKTSSLQSALSTLFHPIHLLYLELSFQNVGLIKALCCLTTVSTPTSPAHRSGWPSVQAYPPLSTPLLATCPLITVTVPFALPCQTSVFLTAVRLHMLLLLRQKHPSCPRSLVELQLTKLVL